MEKLCNQAGTFFAASFHRLPLSSTNLTHYTQIDMDSATCSILRLGSASQGFGVIADTTRRSLRQHVFFDVTCTAWGGQQLFSGMFGYIFVRFKMDRWLVSLISFSSTITLESDFEHSPPPHCSFPPFSYPVYYAKHGERGERRKSEACVLRIIHLHNAGGKLPLFFSHFFFLGREGCQGPLPTPRNNRDTHSWLLDTSALLPSSILGTIL